MFVAGNMHDVVIYLGSSFIKGSFLQHNYIICGHYTGAVGLGVTGMIMCSQPTKARYVVVQIHGDNEQLTVCEIFVFTTTGKLKYASHVNHLPRF